MEQLLAGGTQLSEFQVAETLPISTLELPGTVTRLDLVNLPSLTYPGGLTIASMANVGRLMLDNCPNIDPMSLINGLVSSSSIRYIRLQDVNITAPSSILAALQRSGAIGLDSTGAAYEETGRCSGLTGRWIMEDLIDDAVLDSYAAYFPQLTLHNSQYSMVMYSDLENDCENISNLDNRTGYIFGNDYVPSGHFAALDKLSKPCRGNYVNSVMHCVKLSNDDYNFLADGTSVDLTDSSGLSLIHI